MPIGMFRTNTARQSISLTSRPPSEGPAAAAMDPAAPQIPMASARFSAGVSDRTSPSAAGIMPAAPMPWTARAAMSSSTLGATAQAKDATLNNATDHRNSLRRPRTSAKRPAGVSRAAKRMP